MAKTGHGAVLRFVLLFGVVSLFADMTYEGGRGEAGAFLAHLGATGFIVGIVAGGGELVGYLVRSFAGRIADKTGRYWLQAWIGYAINVLSVPALAFAGTWPAAAALIVAERFGRGVRRPATSTILAEAGRTLGSGRAFGFNEALDQIGATVGPLIVAVMIARTGSFSAGFGILIVPAILTLVALAIAASAGRGMTPRHSDPAVPLVNAPRIYWFYVVAGGCIAAGYVDFALIAYRFVRDSIVSIPAISVWFAVAMAVGAVTAPLLGLLLDRFGVIVVAATVLAGAAATPLAFLGTGAVAETGAVLWGLGTVVQDALLLALVARVIEGRRKATAFGVFDTVFGLSWFAGSALCGWLVDRSPLGLVIFSVTAQIASVPFLLVSSGSRSRSQ